MKRTLLFIACVLASITMQAQAEGEYESLLSEGKTWTMSYRSPYQEGMVNYVESKLEGDTIIGDVTFKRKYDREWKQGDATPQEWKATDYYVGEDGGKVYYYYKVLNDEPQLLMDFSAKVDDVIPVQIEGTPSGIKVVSVDNTILGSSTDQTRRRCLDVRDTWHDRGDTWIEGIGSMTFGIENYFMNMLTGGIPKFIKCQYNGQTLYEDDAQGFFPEGTKWTEIRLDTLKYDSWYSKEGDKWVPNFETIEYYVKGEFLDKSRGDGTNKYKCVYTNGPEWTDSLTLLIQEEGDAPYVGSNNVMVSVLIQDYEGNTGPLWPGEIYQFDWSVGKGLYFTDILMSNTTSIWRSYLYYGIIDEIKEDYFGGVKPLKYVDLDGKAPASNPNSAISNVDTQGGRIIQGIGITEWNDGECLFGPSRPYSALAMSEGYPYSECHYRSMLVHFERNGEVLYDVWPDALPQNEYRPFIEDGKVWQVGDNYSGNPVRRVEYYYFDGDTIIDGKTCKQMMCQRYVSPEHPDYAIISQLPTLSYIGAWYEENQKVYLCNEANNQFKLMYDFSVNANDTLQIMGQSYVIGPRQTRGINGFKGVYRDVMMCGEGENTYNTTWLEGVGNIDGPIYSVYLGEEGHALFLMSCTVGDEVIYYNDEYEDGATPEGLGARKRRFDFTHTIKTKPSARMRRGAEQSLYGEYNEQQLSINMNPIDDAYEVRITDESGKVVYERVVNAGSIVGLNVNISAYAKGRYTVTVENNDESFKGEFETQASGIVDVRSKMEDVRKIIHNLQGQRLNTLQKGLNIVNGQKIYVK